MTKTFTAAIETREVTFEASDIACAKRAARRQFDDGYIGDRIRIFEHTATHGPIVVSTGYVGRKGWQDSK